MASEIAAASAATTPARPQRGRQLIKLLVRRRVTISVILFTGLVLVDMFGFGTEPRDVLQFGQPLVLLSELLILAGLALRSWAAGTLRKQKQLATSGPYALVRHPLYVGSFLMMLGFGILLLDPLTIWFVILPVGWLYSHAVRSEERLMRQLFRSQWDDYSRTVPRFVPWRLSGPVAAAWSLAQWLKNDEYQALLGSLVALVGLKLWQLWQ